MTPLIIKTIRTACIFVIMLTMSCTGPFNERGIKEGIVEYEITYLENNLSNFSTSFLPRTMYMKFKDDYASNTIEGFMGVFFVKNITDLKKRQNTTLLKALNNEFFYQGEEKEQPCCMNGFGELDIKETDDTLRLSGFLCKKAIARLPDNSTFDIYYTEDITIRDPNYLTPFHEIDGVLMKFQMKMTSLRMEIEAKKFHQKTVPDDEFEIPPGFRRISKDKMERVVNELME